MNSLARAEAAEHALAQELDRLHSSSERDPRVLPPPPDMWRTIMWPTRYL